MKTIDEIINSAAEPWRATIEGEESVDTWDREEIRDMMKIYAIEVLNDWNEYWKNDGNTHVNGLVESYKKEKRTNMRTIAEVTEEIKDAEDHLREDILREYVREVVDDILSRDELIRVDEGDTVYNYDLFHIYKQKL